MASVNLSDSKLAIDGGTPVRSIALPPWPHFGEAELDPGATSELDKLIGKVKGYGKAIYIEVEGHTDNVGVPALNEKLGWERHHSLDDLIKEMAEWDIHEAETERHLSNLP